MKTKFTLQTLLVAGLLSAAQFAAAEVAIIVNPKSPLASMTADQVSAIFLGKSATLRLMAHTDLA